MLLQFCCKSTFDAQTILDHNLKFKKMSFNILEAVKGHITPDLISKASSFLGESDNGVAKAMSGILPTILGSLVTKATAGKSGAEEIFNSAKDAHSSGLMNGLGNFFGDGDGLLNKGLSMVKGLFGDKTNSIIDTISSFAGIKNSSASSLLSLAAPVATGTLGKYAAETNLNASGLASLLNTQKSSILNMIPGGLSGIVSMLGLGKIGDAVSSLTGGAKKATSSAYNHAEDNVRKATGAGRWLMPLLLIALAALAGWYFLFGGKQGCSSKPADKDTTTIVKPAEETMTPAVTAPVSYKVKLPDGTELDAFKGGIEDKLVGFLSTEWMKLGEDSLKKTWFDFDNLNFNTGSAVITPGSQVQITNIIAILKAFPNAKLKIGGYTDKTGDEKINKRISGERAGAVKTAIEKARLGKQVTGAEGYGSEFAKYPADAPESDRVKDRHVSVSVRG